MQCLAYSPDGRYLAVATPKGRLFIWDAVTLRKIDEVPMECPPVRLKFSPDGRFLAVGCFKGGFGALGLAATQT